MKSFLIYSLHCDQQFDRPQQQKQFQQLLVSHPVHHGEKEEQ